MTSNGIDHTVSYDTAGNETSYFASRTYSPRNLMSTVTDTSQGLDRKELRGKQVVREQNGARPNELIVNQAFFTVGPYKVSCSPADVTMSGTREKPESVTSATSRVYYPPDLRTANVAVSPEREHLAAACR